MAALIADDTQERTEIPVGETSLGRGPFLKVIDKRVSRCHAVIRLDNDQLFIKPVHKNPTFLCASGEAKYIALKKDEWKVISHGDSISLLQNALLFSVEITNDKTQSYDTSDEIEHLRNDVVIEEDSKNEKGIVEAHSNHRQIHTTNIAPTASTDKQKEKPLGSKHPLNLTNTSANKKRILPSWMLNVNSENTSKVQAPKQKNTTTKKGVSKKSKDEKSDNESFTDNYQPTNSEPDVKPSSSGILKQKPRIVNAKTSEVRELSIQYSDEEADDRDNSAINKNKEINTVPLDPQSAKRKKQTSASSLPVCPYGTKCYRKNPAHFKEYSHSTMSDDTDEDDSKKPECEYGISCYRKNPQHLKEYKHTKDTEAEKRLRRTERQVKKGKSVLENTSDDDGEVNTYDYDDSFIDDAGDSSESYADNDDDSDFDPAGKSDVEDENVDELIVEAKEFVRNKEMPK